MAYQILSIVGNFCTIRKQFSRQLPQPLCAFVKNSWLD
ncbi:hypothetical protein HAL07_09620 [Helicobacter ailurogastricus]|uniref:Uncharacterized protein n=1 Tax=Helicobacter ailurogastricus TaxID=1578720 RepID=A0A0K2XBV4_9HELI|nr:hypothetical protein HAL011_02430 [Helicobacter ailurogastricus]CRF43459.1 hypothetical protein HAL013_16960 [Helicobacter ailurogastricus]CRF44012.1 hypothetical protein HAL09_05760 [Helicobacter ailurogastricus]CRF52497.1 hypothetical protein HAL07_09620 [Helicobacter ailurogastricus]